MLDVNLYNLNSYGGITLDNEINFNDILKSKGLKVTKHRTSVLQILSKSKQPLSAEEIYLKLKENSISINLSSIYKIPFLIRM